MALCTFCGRENAEGTKFCVYCGRPQMAAVFPKREELAGQISEIAKAVSKRNDTDLPIPVVLGLVPLALMVAILVIFIIVVGGVVSHLSHASSYESYDVNQLIEDYRTDLSVLIIINFAFYLFFAIITFLLVKRNNDHFEREKGLVEAMNGFVVQAFEKSGLGRRTVSASATLWDDQRNLYLDTTMPTRKNPVVWAAVIMLQGVLGAVVSMVELATGSTSGALSGASSVASLALVGLTVYIWYFLMTDNYAHDGTWVANAEWFRVSLARLGYSAGSMTIPERQPNRSFPLYFVLSIVTLGLFPFYWWYVLVKDPNTHYRRHEIFEDEMLKVLQSHPAWVTASASKQ